MKKKIIFIAIVSLVIVNVFYTTNLKNFNIAKLSLPQVYAGDVTYTYGSTFKAPNGASYIYTTTYNKAIHFLAKPYNCVNVNGTATQTMISGNGSLSVKNNGDNSYSVKSGDKTFTVEAKDGANYSVTGTINGQVVTQTIAFGLDCIAVLSSTEGSSTTCRGQSCPPDFIRQNQ